MGLESAKFINIPVFIIKIFIKLGDLFGIGPLNTTSYKMMLHPNIADKNDLVEYTSINPCKFEYAISCDPLTIQSLWHARSFFLKPLIKISFGLFWIFSGIITAFFSKESGLNLILNLGFNRQIAEFVLYTSCFIDTVFGSFLLFNKNTKIIYILQLSLVSSYSVILTIFNSSLWLDPLGSLAKNIPIILLILILMSVEREK